MDKQLVSYRSTLSHSTYREEIPKGVEIEKERETLNEREIVLQKRLAGLNDAVKREEAKLMDLERRGTEKMKRGMRKLAAALEREAAKTTVRRYYARLERMAKRPAFAPPVKYRPLAASPPPFHHSITININSPQCVQHEVCPSPPPVPISLYKFDILAILVDFHSGKCHAAANTNKSGHEEYPFGVETCLPYFLRKFGLRYNTTKVCVMPNTEDRNGIGFAEMIGLVGGEGCVTFTPGELMSAMHGMEECLVLNCSQSVLCGGVYCKNKLLQPTYTEIPYPRDRLHASLAAAVDHILYRSDLPVSTPAVCFGVPSQAVSRLLPSKVVVYQTPAELLAAGVSFLASSGLWDDRQPCKERICAF